MKLCASIVFSVAIASVLGCGGENRADAQTAGGDAKAGKPADLVKLSQFGHAGSCDLAVGPDGTIHALFSDFKEYGKPAFLYYRASKDNGATWSEPKLVSDDESVMSAGPCRVLVDKGGRVYAIWKYISPNELLEGPNGYALGYLAVRVMNGGSWSKPKQFGDEHKPMVSWFAALAPDGKVNVVYSRADDQVDWKGRGMPAKNANNIDQLIFDGAAEPVSVVRLQTERHFLTPAEQEASKAAGKYPAYEDTIPKNDGTWNLNGYIADDGKARFLAEKYQESGTMPAILRFDGQKLETLVEYKKQYLGYNTFGSPPVLLRGGDGKEHVIRRPEASETELVRDYSDGDKADVITHESPKTKIAAWWASPLAGGKIAAMAAVDPQTDVWDATDLYLSTFDGHGAWGKPINVTANKARATFAANNGVSVSTSYRPTYAAAATLKDGSIGIILLNAEKTISGINTVGITDGGRAVTGTASFSSENPYVSFVRVQP